MAVKINDAFIDELVKGCKTADDVVGSQGVVKELTKRLLERLLDTELTTHLGYEKHKPREKKAGNARNGHSAKTILTGEDEIKLQVPRDRKGRFEPIAVPKHQRRFDGFDQKITSMYARGMSLSEIQGHLKEIYGVEVSPTLISNVTDAVVEDVREWQSRPLDPIYPVMFFDAIMVKSRENGKTENKAVYLALGINMEGRKELLGMWIADTEGAKFWLNVITEIKNRGVEDILIACIDGLKGFPEAIHAVFPRTEIQLCVVHMIRNSLKYVSYKDYKELLVDLKGVYKAQTEDEALQNLDKFAAKWDPKYPTISQLWRRNWEFVRPFFAYSEEIRKVIYTTNAIESINNSVRKIIRSRGAFPNNEAILKSMYLALMNASKKWTMPIRNWGLALSRFSIRFEGRVPL
ncbi:MAG TPA: IS256 family transposase [Lentisphaeria bacterium]|nr:MAG: transposase [Lentisphaerae bacterium GWF2_49_21]HBC85801.1 IS256 family transposase [Lentisphaeria bacterium]